MDKVQTLTQKQQQLVEQARSQPGVIEALRIFEAACARSPRPTSQQPVVKFATGANS